MTKMTSIIFFLPQEKVTSNELRELAMSREHPFPFLIMEGRLEASPSQFHLAADKQIICSFTSSLVDATLGLLGSYYVFMFNYPACLNNFYLYLQKCVLQINDGRKLPSSVITLVNEIDRLSKLTV